MPAFIGITQCLDDRGRWRAGRDYLYSDLAYAQAIAHAGGVPVGLTPAADPDALLERIDGLLLPGGDDFLPAPGRYPDSVEFDPTPQAQLDFDGALLDAARRRKLPVLGICYGMQRLALARGGSLYHHLASDLPEAGPHKGDGPEARHGLRVEPGSRLAAILERAPESVNSVHHQAVRKPGTGMRVCARAIDGVVEAIESDDAFCIGVQWHPERQPDAASRALFRAFVEAAEGCATNG